MDRADRNLTLLSCVELAAAIRERRTTCVAAMEAVLGRARAVQPRLNCFLRIDADTALAAAHLLDREIARGYVRGPLHGVPMAHKDMYYRRGVVSSCGSKIMRDTPAPATAKVLEHLDAAGAIQFGVLNMAEFAMGPRATTGTMVSAAIPGTSSASLAARLRDRARQWRRAPRSPRLAPTPVARCGCPRRSVGWRVCGRRTDGCPLRTSFRFARRSTRWGRSRAPSRTPR
jgi:hypothetical protein